MSQNQPLPDVRLVCLVRPDHAKTMLASNKEKNLQEVEVLVKNITSELDKQELKSFLEWSELPWYRVKLSHIGRHEEYIADALKQYQQFKLRSSQGEKSEHIVSPELAEETIPANLESSLQELSNIQQPSDEDLTGLARELAIQLQSTLTLLKKWEKYLESNKEKVLFGELHSYPKQGKWFWNFCPHGDDARSGKKDKRIYVRQGEVETYLRAISLGRQLSQIPSLQQSLMAFLDEMQSTL